MDSIDNFRERFEAPEQQTKAMGAHSSTVARRRRWWPITGSVAAVAVLGLALALPLPVLAKTFFTFTTIDVPFSGAFQTTPTGINDKGQIAGFSEAFAIGELSKGQTQKLIPAGETFHLVVAMVAIHTEAKLV